MEKQEEHIKHHYVPQCYQRRFSTDKVSVKYFNKDTQELCSEKIKNFCQIENLYYLEQDENHYSLEVDFFSQVIEDKLGKLLTSFDEINGANHTISFNKDKKKSVANQIVLQYMRTPTYRNIRYKNETQAYLYLISVLLKQIGLESEELCFYSDKREYHKRRLYDDSEISEIVEELVDDQWELLYTNNGEFYTSDNPIVIETRTDMPVTYCDAIKYFDEIYFPLNPHLLLHIIDKQADNNKNIAVQTIEQNKVSEINNIIKKKAPHYIIYQNSYY